REQQAALDAYELAEMLDLFSRAAMAHKAASAEGYEEMVALCRQLIRDYPDTILANSAKVLLREMPPAEQVRFDIQPYETTPVPIIAFDPAAGLGDHAAGPQMLGGYTWAEIEQMVINDHEKFMLIIMESLAVGR
ncbi:MAG TPA: hypothetical protein VLH60_05705, partial [Sedimentisphaerales bacterium]|nr:hypothetical protein [Sedimentisphaerales bacterium]